MPRIRRGGARRAILTARLASKMAINEDAERQALNGELATLERAWAEAEGIAAIADSLLLPESVAEQFDRLEKTVTC